MRKIHITGLAVCLLCFCQTTLTAHAGKVRKRMEKKVKVSQTLTAWEDTLTYSPADKSLLDSIDQQPDIIHTASGLRYKVITAAKGAKPTEADTILVGYRGLHADGSLFWEDAAEEFPLKGTIKGFREGVGLMSIGAEYILYIPSALGYGSAGIKDLILPNEPLIYEVTLKGIKKQR